MPTPKTAKRQPCQFVPNGGYAAWPVDVRHCSTCQCLLRMEAVGVDDWTWVDADGNRDGNAADAPKLYLADPAAWWAEAVRRMDAGDEQAAQLYSSLKARLDLGGTEWWRHYHHPQPADTAPKRIPPFCCGSPMHAQPRGWVCRVNGSLVPYAEY